MDNIKILIKNSKEVVDKIGYPLLLDGLVKDLVGPQVVSKLVRHEDKKKFMEELKKCGVSFVNNRTSNYDRLYNTIKINRKVFQKYLEKNNKEDKNLLKIHIGEEVAHFIAHKKDPLKNIILDFGEVNVEEYYGRLGALVFTKGKILGKQIEQKNKFVHIVDNFLKIVDVENPKEFYKLYLNIKKEIKKERSCCRNCEECTKKNNNKSCHDVAVEKIDNLFEKTKEFLNRRISNDSYINHILRYALANKEYKNGKSLKELFNIPKTEVNKKLSKDIEKIRKIRELLQNEMLLDNFKKNINILKEDPELFKLCFISDDSKDKEFSFFNKKIN